MNLQAIHRAVRATERQLDAAKAKIGNRAIHDHGWWNRHRAAMREVAAHLTEHHGARISQRYDGARVRMQGIASTSTSGLEGALHNWMAAARKRLGEPAA